MWEQVLISWILLFVHGLAETFHNPGTNDEPFLHMVVDDYSGNVYVGAANHLYQLSEYLTLHINVTNDPLNKERTDNKAITIYSDRSRLIVCNSHGFCELRSLNNISIIEKSSHAMVASKTGYPSIIFVEPGLSSREVLYVASAKDHDDATVASLSLDMDRLFNLALPGTSISIIRRGMPHTEFVTGFSSGHFSYFCIMQDDRERIVSKLIRVCNNDPYFHSYTEVPLECRYREKKYNRIQAAYVVKPGLDLANPMGISTENDILVAAFVDEDNGKRNQASTICIYSLRSIDEKFMDNIRVCARGNGYSFGINHCVNVSNEDDDLACDWTRKYPFGGKEPVIVDAIYFTSTLITSLVATVIGSQTVVLAGTFDGHLKKILVTSLTRAEEHKDTTILPKGTVIQVLQLDHLRQSLYAMTINTITLVPLYECSVYHDCSSCLSDYPFCGWCNRGTSGSCTPEKKCSEIGVENWLKGSEICPYPKITSFEPMSGLIEGGTRITINGVNLGNRFSDIKDAVRVTDVVCKPVKELYKPGQSITCDTGSVPLAKSGPIVFIIKEGEDFMTNSSDIFSYVNPIITDFSPKRGSVLGDTVVTIEGQFLDAGSNVTVSIGGTPCDVLPNRNASRIQCRTGASDSVRSGTITLQVDNASREFLKHQFFYAEPPEITKIEPNGTIVSGGILVDVTGKNFNPNFAESIEKPWLVFQYLNKSYYGDCTVITDFFMQCQTPTVGASDSPMHCRTPSVEISNSSWNMEYVDISFDFDRGETPENLSTVLEMPSVFKLFPDPMFEKIEGGIKNGYIRIPVNHVNLQLFKNYVRVSIFDEYCTPRITEKELFCDSLKIQPDSLPEVRAMVGQNINCSIEQSVDETKEKDGMPPSTIVAASFAGVAGLAIVAVVLATRLRSKQREAQLKELQRKLLDSCNASIEVNKSMPIHEQLDALPYDMRFDIPHSRIKLGEMIGQGNFGLAYKGHLLMDPELRDGLLVVVKMPKGTTEDITAIYTHNIWHSSLTVGGSKEVENFEVLIQELKMMIYAGDHINVLKLHGAVTELMQHHKLYVLTEYCSKGSLWEVLVSKQNQNNILEVSANGYSTPRSLSLDEGGSLLFDLLSYSYQVAHGMEYLAAKNVIHRDLAARNILLTKDDIIKICDFGLSKGGEYYTDKRRQTPLPVKWTPIEAFEKGLFTVKSDVWSYGILNWEIFTLGKIPYSELDIREVLPNVRGGYRLEKPDCTPNAVYEMMRMCWAKEPEERPTFTQCKSNLAIQLELVSKKLFKALILKLFSETKLEAPMELSNLENGSAEAYPSVINGNLPSEVFGAKYPEAMMLPLMSNPTYGTEDIDSSVL